MTERNRGKMKKLMSGMAAVIMAMSMAACSSSEPTEGGNNAETTTTTAASTEAPEETTEAPAETEAPKETEAESETTTEAAKETEAETTEAPKETSKEADDKETTTKAVSGKLSDDFDAELDAMIASAEADIPDIDDILGDDYKKSDDKDKEKTTTTTKAETTTAAKETEPAPATNADLKNEHQFVFDGQLYDNSTMTSEGVAKPASWTKKDTLSDKQYENPAYERTYLVEGAHKGVMISIGDAKSNGVSAIPTLELYKGLTWGASVADIKAAYGEPAKEGHSEQYGTQLTNLFYAAADGSLIIYEVSSDWGLVVVNCCGK